MTKKDYTKSTYKVVKSKPSVSELREAKFEPTRLIDRDFQVLEWTDKKGIDRIDLIVCSIEPFFFREVRKAFHNELLKRGITVENAVTPHQKADLVIRMTELTYEQVIQYKIVHRLGIKGE